MTWRASNLIWGWGQATADNEMSVQAGWVLNMLAEADADGMLIISLSFERAGVDVEGGGLPTTGFHWLNRVIP